MPPVPTTRSQTWTRAECKGKITLLLRTAPLYNEMTITNLPFHMEDLREDFMNKGRPTWGSPARVALNGIALPGSPSVWVALSSIPLAGSL